MIKLNILREILPFLEYMKVSSTAFDSPEPDLQLRTMMCQYISIYSCNIKKIMQNDCNVFYPIGSYLSNRNIHAFVTLGNK